MYVEGVTHHCGAVSGVLATAIVAQQHADVWDAAAMLLREHHTCVKPLYRALILSLKLSS